MKLSKEHNLKAKFPKLAKEWHPTKNGSLKPEDVLPKSNKKVCWQCRNGHEWIAQICDRVRGTGCRLCYGRVATKNYNLRVKYPKLALEWHPYKNGSLKPDEVTPRSGKKVWWKCKYGHVYEAIIAARAVGSGCPHCSRQTSRLQIRIYLELKSVFRRTRHRIKIDGEEIDVYIPELNLGIEYDSSYFHKSKDISDNNKNLILSNKIILLRVRDYGLKKILKSDIILDKNTSDIETILRIMNFVLNNMSLNKIFKNKVKTYIKNRKLIRNNVYNRLITEKNYVEYNTSFKRKHPKLVSELHPTKNVGFLPQNVDKCSGIKVYWKCKRKGHTYIASIANRVNGTGCPFCAGKIASKEYNLKKAYPKIALEWHPTRNGILLPENIVPHSGKKVYWLCSKKHEYMASSDKRTQGRGCPFCAGKIASKEYNLKKVYPKIALEWHPSKNGTLLPENMLPNSNKKVYWICPKKHEYLSGCNKRAMGRGCPYCAGQKVCYDNCLKHLNPKLAKEWHPIKNGKLTPEDVTLGTKRKVWWKCKKKGHDYIASVAKRSIGRGCSYCAGKIANKDNNLKKYNPKLAKEWHPIKNGSLKPENVTPNSHKSAWWLCEKGHEWSARISARNRGNGCPICYRLNIKKS